ncbi:MAG TPA: AAA family ATPase [Candidatus Paceibacterota bacterium]|nr:AAA family ATPase [Candidatus Paceibacterota bacterium]
MLRQLSLTNFKPFGDRQVIPVAPLTLIFGANSSGKSSIIQSLLLGQHACETGSFEASHIRAGGEAMDLGGYRQYVHQHDTSRVVELGIEWSPDLGIESALARGQVKFKTARADYHIGINRNTGSTDVRQPGVLEFKFSVDGVPILELTSTEEQVLRPTRVNLVAGKTDLFELGPSVFGSDKGSSGGAKLASRLRFRMKGLIPSTCDRVEDLLLWRKSSSDARLEEFRESFSEKLMDEHNLNNYNQPDWLMNLSCFVEDMASDLADLFRQISYLGPLRMMPSRYLTELDAGNPNWNAGGGCAWEQLKNKSEVRNAVNKGLSVLEMPYEIKVRELVEAGDPTAQKLISLSLIDPRSQISLSHRDVGIGVSQVIPVIATLAGMKRHLIAIEQPEIHLHPAAQAKLGDLFIESALGPNRNTLLLETHSEHLILRILRRVRETSEGNLPSGAAPVKPDDMSVVFVDQKSTDSVVHQLPVTPDGDFTVPWPGGFFAERLQDLP